MTAVAALGSSVLAQTQAVQTASGASAGSALPQAAASSQSTPDSTTVSITGIQAATPLVYTMPAPQPVCATGSQYAAKNVSTFES